MKRGAPIMANHTATEAELFFRVAIWLSDSGRASVEGIRARYGVSRATAYRWLSAWRAARGVA